MTRERIYPFSGAQDDPTAADDKGMRNTDDDGDADRLRELQAAIEDGTYECCAEGIAAAILSCGDLFEDNDEWLA